MKNALFLGVLLDAKRGSSNVFNVNKGMKSPQANSVRWTHV